MFWHYRERSVWRQEHWGIPDSSAVVGTEAKRLEAFRQVRDEIGVRITQFLNDAK